MTTRDKESIAQLLKETIIQLCKANVLYSGQVEVDGIICISGQVEGQELVIKVHEIIATPQDLRNPYADFRYPPIGPKFSTFQHLIGDYQRRDLKRRRLEPEYDYLRPSLAFSYLSKLVYDRNHPSAFTAQPTEMDHRTSATDLSIKSSLASASANNLLEVPNDGSHSPQNLDVKYDPREDDPSPQTPIRSLLGRRPMLPMERWSPNKPLPSVPQCRLCSSNFETSEALSDHNEAVHSVFTCLCCFKTFTSRSNLERHSRLHTGHKPYTCNVCGKAFSRKDHLSNHATKHAFKCSTCSQRYADRSTLVSHYLYDHSATLTSICTYCNKGFCSAELYEEHLKSHPQFQAGESKSGTDDAQVTPRSLSRQHFSCISCSFETTDKVSLAKHELVHSDGERTYTCLSCGKISDDPLQYGDHLMLHQNERDVFECCLCHQVCSTISSLRRHEAAHVCENSSDVETPGGLAAEDRLQCGECNRSFETLGILREHLEVHELAKGQYVCTTCDVAYDNRISLQDHLATSGHFEVQFDESNHAPEDCSGAADMAGHRRDKRKQKQPKLVISIKEGRGICESDIEVVEPKSPGVSDEYRNFVITDNPASVIQVSKESDVEIKMEPVRSIMNRPSMTSSSATKSRDHSRPDGQDLSSLLLTNSSEYLKQERPDETVESQPRRPYRSHQNSSVTVSSKRSRRRAHRGSREKSGRRSVTSESHGSLNGSPDDGDNNNTISVRNENRLVGGGSGPPDLPLGPFACAFCNYEADTFHLVDNHCSTLHSRSPCMFCSKTFAQKANRDRHHCLHTGDRPYACPECDEKFSRGDKLKMHRVRAHGIQYPLYSSRHKDPALRGEREFSASPSSFLGGSQTDGYAPIPAFYLGSVPTGSALEIRDLDGTSRPDSILGRHSADAFLKGDIGGGARFAEMPETMSVLMSKWLMEKRTNSQWTKMETTDEDNQDEVSGDTEEVGGGGQPHGVTSK